MKSDSMKLAHYLARRLLPQQVIDDLLPYIPRPGEEHVFCDAATIVAELTVALVRHVNLL
jgi:hypothetical protein